MRKPQVHNKPTDDSVTVKQSRAYPCVEITILVIRRGERIKPHSQMLKHSSDVNIGLNSNRSKIGYGLLLMGCICILFIETPMEGSHNTLLHTYD